MEFRSEEKIIELEQKIDSLKKDKVHIFSKVFTELYSNLQKEKNKPKNKRRVKVKHKKNSKNISITSYNIGLKPFYVYALMDSRNDDVFYIGKGCEDRVYQHEKEVLRGNVYSLKQKWINKIHKDGADVKELIIGRFDTEEEAFAVESTLIHWVYGIENLRNDQSGHGVNSIRPKGNLLFLQAIDEPELNYCEREKEKRDRNNIKGYLRNLQEFIESNCNIKFDTIDTGNDRHTYLVKYTKGVRFSVSCHHTARRSATVTIESLDTKNHNKECVREICDRTLLECKDNGRYGRLMPAKHYTDKHEILEIVKRTLAELEKV